jgi:hypothetical protein
MTIANQLAHPITTDNWRLTSGFLLQNQSSFEGVHILLGHFLADRTSENPLPEEQMFAGEGVFEWGHALPLEKVINSRQDFEFLLLHPHLLRNSIVIIEPWEHVGVNPHGEVVRASKNVAYIAQKVADIDSILLPV